jgi:hypothetical protein
MWKSGLETCRSASKEITLRKWKKGEGEERRKKMLLNRTDRAEEKKTCMSENILNLD